MHAPRSLRAIRLPAAAALTAVAAALGGALPTAPSALASELAEANRVAVTSLTHDTTLADRLTAITDGDLVLMDGQTERRVPLADAVEISFPTVPDAPHSQAEGDVAVDLWSGEQVRGRIESGDDEGITLETPLLGAVRLGLDSIAGIRFLQRLAQVVEPPDLTPSDDADNPDTLHVIGGDRIRCTLESLNATGVKVLAGDSTANVAYSRMTVLTLSQIGDPPKRSGDLAIVVVLRDGTRIEATKPVIEGRRLNATSISGFSASAALKDIVAVQVLSDRFRYLSDVEPTRLEVKPFWESVAGKPEELYAPRMDRAFGGGPLRCGGRAWLKGVGCYGGTTLEYDLGGNYSHFQTAVGLDDDAGDLGGVLFEILVDGKRAWTSGFVRAPGTEGRGRVGPIQSGRIDLKGKQTLTLRVLHGDKEDPYPIQDEANWLGAMLVK